MADDARLRRGVGKRGRGRKPEARGRVRRRDGEPDGDRPARGQARVKRPALAECRAEGSSEEKAVVEEDDERRAHHQRLGRGADRAGQRRQRVPAARVPRRGGAADRGVERAEIEQPREGLGALDDVRHRLGGEGMRGPQRRARQREPVRRTGVARGEPRTRERATEDCEQRERRQHVNREVYSVVAADIEPAERVVHGKCQRHDRARGAAQNARQRPQVTDAGVPGDAVQVVEDERAREAVAVGDERGRDDEGGGNRAAEPAQGPRTDRGRGSRGRGGPSGRVGERAPALGRAVGHERRRISSGAPSAGWTLRPRS
jgi:hypothetical protein